MTKNTPPEYGLSPGPMIVACACIGVSLLVAVQVGPSMHFLHIYEAMQEFLFSFERISEGLGAYMSGDDSQQEVKPFAQDVTCQCQNQHCLPASGTDRRLLVLLSMMLADLFASPGQGRPHQSPFVHRKYNIEG